jgi:uncharacterized RDD family membrane protein YckC
MMENKTIEMETSITRPLAHPGKRFQGQFIDGLVTYFVGYSVFFMLKLVIDAESAGYTGIVIGMLYFLFSDSLPNGQSIGKKLLGLSVVSKLDFRPCTPAQSFFRNITFLFGILDWIFIFFGSHQRLGDFLASTIVIKLEKKRSNSIAEISIA